MKITLMVHQFFPHWQSGTEVLTRDTAKKLIVRGHDVEVWTGHHQPHPRGISYDRFEYEGIPVHRYYGGLEEKASGVDLTHAEYENRRFAEFFAGRLQKRRPDVVHAFHLYRLSSSALKAAHDLGIRTVYTPTDFWSVCPAIQLLLPDGRLCLGPARNSLNCVEHMSGWKMPSYLKAWPSSVLCAGTRLLEFFRPKDRELCGRFRSLLKRMDHHRRQFARVDAILTPTRFLKKMLVDNGIPSERMSHQSFGVDLERIPLFDKIKKTNRFCVGFIGTLIRHKGPHVLIQAIQELPLDIPIEARIYGRSSDVPEYSRSLRVLAGDDPRISFCEIFPNHEIGDVLSRLDVLVVPSLWYENSPLVVFSAQAAKVPVIASDLGGLSEVISHQANGLLFPAGDHRRLAQILLQVSQDPGLLSCLSQNAPRPKSMDRYVDELEEIYGKMSYKKEELCR